MIADAATCSLSRRCCTARAARRRPLFLMPLAGQLRRQNMHDALMADFRSAASDGKRRAIIIYYAFATAFLSLAKRSYRPLPHAFYFTAHSAMLHERLPFACMIFLIGNMMVRSQKMRAIFLKRISFSAYTLHISRLSLFIPHRRRRLYALAGASRLGSICHAAQLTPRFA